MISEISFIQYSGYFFERIVNKKYVDILEEKRKEIRFKKILNKEKEEVQQIRENGISIDLLV